MNAQPVPSTRIVRQDRIHVYGVQFIHIQTESALSVYATKDSTRTKDSTLRQPRYYVRHLMRSSLGRKDHHVNAKRPRRLSDISGRYRGHSGHDLQGKSLDLSARVYRWPPTRFAEQIVLSVGVCTICRASRFPIVCECMNVIPR